MDQERILLAIGERVLACSSADETEVMVQQTAERLTRFANNAIHQNVEERSTLVRVRARPQAAGWVWLPPMTPATPAWRQRPGRPAR